MYRERSGAYRVWWGDLRERDHLEEPGVDRMISIKTDLQEVECGRINVVMNLRVP